MKENKLFSCLHCKHENNLAFKISLNYWIMNGLVLIGGKSQRMGQAKGELIYYQVEQQYHIYHLLKSFCTTVYLSCRVEQSKKLDSNYNCIVDKYENIGPLSGVLSAFDKDSNTAWFVVACDMPYVTIESLNYLIEQRNKEKVATVFKNKGRVEPLLGIWEISSLPYLKEAFEKKWYSLRRILEENEVNVLKPQTIRVVSNINTPKAYLKVLKDLKRD